MLTVCFSLWMIAFQKYIPKSKVLLIYQMKLTLSKLFA